eukprot:6187920-Pleurochrysis_carterae.AAC.1
MNPNEAARQGGRPRTDSEMMKQACVVCSRRMPLRSAALAAETRARSFRNSADAAILIAYPADGFQQAGRAAVQRYQCEHPSRSTRSTVAGPGAWFGADSIAAGPACCLHLFTQGRIIYYLITNFLTQVSF